VAAPLPPAGRAAFAPAAAVLVAATIGALAASGAFGGDQASPPLDTGIVPQQAASRVTEGQVARVVDDLREAADRAGRERAAARRDRATPDPAPPVPSPAPAVPAPAPAAPDDAAAPAAAAPAAPAAP
jgi:hypothetical protein